MIVKTTILLVSVAVVLAAPAGTWSQGDDQKTELKIKLPKPLFVGTPTNIKGVILGSDSGKARKPFFVPKGADTLLSLGKKVTSSDSMPVVGSLEQVTDGDKEGIDGCFVELGPGKQWVQIDLGEVCTISAVVVWHYHSMARVYRDVVVHVADDADFINNVRTVFNNDMDNTLGMGVGKDFEYIETNEGKLMDAKAVNARYLRLYCNGSTAGEMNHYIEVDVYGKKGAATAAAPAAAKDEEPKTELKVRTPKAPDTK